MAWTERQRERERERVFFGSHRPGHSTVQQITIELQAAFIEPLIFILKPK